MNKPIVSLCLPTNGVVEWVFPVLDSIFEQKIDQSLFEVVITDNGDNLEFKEKIKDYIKNHVNIVYSETKALPFLNEIESYKRASGLLIKFVNHRTMLVDGALKKIINFAKENMNKKPIIYFANGVLKLERRQHIYNDFDQFVKNLSYWSSWSTGMTIWKEDFDKLSENITEYNELFPHTTVLFRERKREKYVIDNSVIMKELPTGKIPKGRYDLFYAFCVEYPSIINDLLREESITVDTFKYVRKRNLNFIASQYLEYCILKKPCSYILDGLPRYSGIFYRMKEIRTLAYLRLIYNIFIVPLKVKRGKGK